MKLPQTSPTAEECSSKPPYLVDGEHRSDKTNRLLLNKLSPDIRARFEANETTPLLKLPVELRILIYECVFAFKTMHVSARVCLPHEKGSWTKPVYYTGDLK